MRLCASPRWVVRYLRSAVAPGTRVSVATRQECLEAVSTVSTCSTRCYATGSTGFGKPAGVSSGAAAADLKSAQNAVSSKVRSSRFVRTIAGVEDSVQPSGHPESGGVLQEGGRVTRPALHLRLSAPPDLFSAAAVTAYLQRLHSLLRHERHAYTRSSAVHELGKIVLPLVKGIDGGTVLLLLQTLRMADAPRDMPLVRDATTWMGLHGLNLTVPQTMAAIELLLHFDGTVASEVAAALTQRTPQSTLLSLPTTRVVSILTAILLTVTYGEHSQVTLQSITQVECASQHKLLSAEGLRDACISGDLHSVSPGSLAQLLRSLWLFKHVNRFFYSTEAAAEWRSLEDSVCHVLAMTDKCAEVPLSDVVALIGDLYEWKNQRSSSEAVVMGKNDPLEQISVALLLRLKDVTRRVRCGAPESSLANSILPEPWAMSDISAVWSQRLACTDGHGVTTVVHSLGHDGNGSETAGAYVIALRDLQEAIVGVVSARCKTEPQSIAVLQMTARVCSELVVSWMATAQQARDSADLQGAGEDLSTIMPDLASLIPEAVLQELLDGISAQLQADSITWTPQMVREAVTTLGNSRDSAHRAQALELAKTWYRQLQARAQDGARLQPIELLAFFMPTLLCEEKKGVTEAVKASLSRWSVAEVLYFFSEIAICGQRDGGVEGIAVLRESGKLLCPYVAKASAAQLVGLVECYGAAQVRSDDFCEAVAARLSELLRATVADASRETMYSSVAPSTAAPVDHANAPTVGDAQALTADAAAPSRNRTAGAVTSPQVTLSQLARLLRSLALMETRQATPFVDAAHTITCAADADQGTAEQITHLIAAYAKMLIWSYPVIRALAERLLRINRSEVTLSHLVTAQLALLRMDVSLPPVTGRFYEQISQVYNPATTGSHISSPCANALHEMVVQLSILARLCGHPSDTPWDEVALQVLIDRVVACADRLRVDEVAEVLLSLGRLGKGDSAAFESLTVRTLGMLPKVPPQVMAHVVEAYALAGRGRDTELFTLVADRTVAMRHEMASVTIASILASFAKAGARNDRLFIEVIPRVRHVATYGTPRDVVNVVSAYASVNLWHYKLFARLAERAIQLRGDFRTPEVVALFQAYATVQMRYDRLFTEFAPRVQTLIHLFSPADLASIVSSYAQLDIRCPPVWKATAAQAVTVAESFALEDARRLLDAFASQSFFNQECVEALTRRFPELASISGSSSAATADGRESDGSDSQRPGREERVVTETSECV
ncbi:hypothetical protein JKF63_00738 [Porcisia hertigi]|uniref:RNA-editing substrate-binding complex 6 protein domain-containing protein n=1 Tax=Porcisia hertigi TaxID=2761500 RepID=A0A836GYV0_9TRYP|nr:hypothetical protein JKF63_00738 [Porcisia hertigi]